VAELAFKIMNPRFKYLVRLFQKLPGVGPRQATRFVLALLNRDDQELQELGEAITTLRQSVKFCKECFNVAEENLCMVCSNPKRDSTKLLVVEKITDLDSIEKTGLYRGLYHVLGNSINPVEGITVEHIRVRELTSRVQKLSREKDDFEVILATGTDTAGETTALYLRELFKDNGITITRLGRGLSAGANLEYADEITLKNALDYRK
jgi:recombination protein RecR